jgi:hypothetical protein
VSDDRHAPPPKKKKGDDEDEEEDLVRFYIIIYLVNVIYLKKCEPVVRSFKFVNINPSVLNN